MAVKLPNQTGDDLAMDLGDGLDARSGVFEGASDFIRMRIAGLDAEKSDHGGEAVFDAMAHFPRQQGSR
jgi:hypothetical protein